MGRTATGAETGNYKSAQHQTSSISFGSYLFFRSGKHGKYSLSILRDVLREILAVSVHGDGKHYGLGGRSDAQCARLRIGSAKKLLYHELCGLQELQMRDWPDGTS